MAGSNYEEVMWGYVFKEIFPYFMRSRFAERAYFKPKGYAGDFLMMEHIYADTPKGEGKLGEIVDASCLHVITSYSIHYTKLYDHGRHRPDGAARCRSGGPSRA